MAVDPVATWNIEPTAPVDWSVAWRDHVTAVTLGNLVIAPPWLAGGLDPARTIAMSILVIAGLLIAAWLWFRREEA